MDYTFYVCDVETTGLDCYLHSPIEISILRLSNGDQKKWLLKPTNPDTIELGALKVNGHKLEDLLGKTKEGRELYKNPNEVIIEIENWLSEDAMPSESRFLIGHNISFDKFMMEQLWVKCNAKDSFPFGRRYLDTMVIELFLDYCKGQFSEAYNLGSLNKKYGIKNEKAHTADADARATKELFIKQVELFRKILNV